MNKTIDLELVDPNQNSPRFYRSAYNNKTIETIIQSLRRICPQFKIF